MMNGVDMAAGDSTCQRYQRIWKQKAGSKKQQAGAKCGHTLFTKIGEHVSYILDGLVAN